MQTVVDAVRSEQTGVAWSTWKASKATKSVAQFISEIHANLLIPLDWYCSDFRSAH